MRVDAILGLQWGDEGKGKLVDMLSEHYALVVRFQGGPNAGHTIHIGAQSLVLHQVPSGILQPNVRNMVGGGVVLDPVALQAELRQLDAFVPDARQRLYIAEEAHLILPLHKALERYEERYRGLEKIGSTGKGIGPCYQDKYARRGLRVCDGLDIGHAKKRYNSIKKWYEPYLDDLDFEEERAFWEAVEGLRTLQVVGGYEFVHNTLQKGGRVLAEGAQGTLLDIDHGTYPYVTSSHTSIGGVCTGLGVSTKQIGRIYGVCKAYCTRVGEGPFPSEIHGKIGEQLHQNGKEIGATTGRKRRCGWLDVGALCHAIRCNGVDELLMTKVDVLSGMGTFQVYTEPRLERAAPRLEPTVLEDPSRYKTFEAWAANSNFIDLSERPKAFTHFLSYIESATGTPITGFSYGPERESFVFKPT